MIRTYPSLYRLTPQGGKYLESTFDSGTPPDLSRLEDRVYALPVANSRPLVVKDFKNKREMTDSVISAFGELAVVDSLDDLPLWGWITLALITRICPVRPETNLLKRVERAKVIPSQANDYQKAQRHLVRMPTQLRSMLGDCVDHLLCGGTEVHGEVFEQLTAQQDMFTPEFQLAAQHLYYDANSGQTKKGASSKGPGSARRLRTIRRQLDVTYDVVGRTKDEILDLLPDEFQKFKGAS